MTVVSLSTGSLYTYGIARVFDLAAETGFDAVEILMDHRWDSRQPDYLRQLSRESGLPIAAVHSPFRPFVPGWPHDSVGRLRETVALARDVGTGVVVAHLPLRIGGARIEFYGFRPRNSGGIPQGALLLPIPLGGEKAYREFLLNGLAAFETEQGVWIGVENMPVRWLLGRMVDIHWLNDLETLAGLPHLTLDTTHLGTRGLDPVEVYERLKSRIIHVHLSNFDGREHRLLDGGHLPLGRLLERLAGDGYPGAVSVELSPEVLEAEEEGKVRAHLRRMVAFCRRHTR